MCGRDKDNRAPRKASRGRMAALAECRQRFSAERPNAFRLPADLKQHYEQADTARERIDTEYSIVPQKKLARSYIKTTFRHNF